MALVIYFFSGPLSSFFSQFEEAIEYMLRSKPPHFENES